jgi:putative phosphoesterase
MKIGIISDVHGHLQELTRVVNDMKDNEVDEVIVLGDIIFDINHETDPQSCFDLIESLKPLVWIKGNTDDWLNEIGENFVAKSPLEERILTELRQVEDKVTEKLVHKIKSLREKEEIILMNYRILCVHGSDRKINEPIGVTTSQEELDALFDRMPQDILLCGHTHSAFIAAGKNKIVMNVGSVGLPKDHQRLSYGIVSITESSLEYGIRRL